MRLSHEELVFLNKFSYTVLEMRDKYSDLDAVEDPLTIAVSIFHHTKMMIDAGKIGNGFIAFRFAKCAGSVV